MLKHLRVVAFALLLWPFAVAQSKVKVIVCWDDSTPHVKNNPFSRNKELRVSKGAIDLIQRDQVDMTRVPLPPELKARQVRDARQINLLGPLKWESHCCQVADREPNGAIEFH